MDYVYALTPLVAWLTAGSLKFIINSIKADQLAFGLIGYGGLPSNHSAIVSSAAAMVAIREGVNDPVFGIAVALALIVVLDASSLRRQIGFHASEINRLRNDSNVKPLRESVGHTYVEIGVGLFVGILTALSVDFFVKHSV